MPDIVTAYESFNARNQTPGATDTFTRAPVIGNAQSTIDLNSASGGISVMQFPTDAPPNHFVIVEAEYQLSGTNPDTIAPGAPLTSFSKVYRLPLPVNLVNEFQVMYDSDFNFMSLFSSTLNQISRNNGALGTVASAISGVGSLFGGAVQAGLSISVNTFKTVTLAVPRFRRIALEWRLYPKTRQESDMITKIVHGLNTGMHPKKQTYVFTFPKVYLMQFNAGPQYMFKFKPAVLERIQIDYTGGAGVPAFYKDDKPIPQGYVVRTTWLELELWTRENFVADDGGNGLPSNNPGSVITTGFSDNTIVNLTAPL